MDLFVSGRLRKQMEAGESWSSQIGDMQRMDDAVVQESVQIRQYEGRLKGSPLSGENVLIKMYPRIAECDALAANELRIQAKLQPPNTEHVCDQLNVLLGGYETDDAHCLVFRRFGQMITLGQYVRQASEAFKAGNVVGSMDVWDVLDPKRSEMRRKRFLVHVFREIAQGLDFMHQHDMLHQSLGAESVALSHVDEMDVSRLRVQITNLALGVDASMESLSSGRTLEEIWDISSERAQLQESLPAEDELWRSARNAGAWSEIDRRNFGVADDVASLGLVYLYASLASFSEQGVMDGPRLYRLVLTTFDSDLTQFRDYCSQDDQLNEAVAFLDSENEAGWELIQAMVQPDWKSRPTAASCLNHLFLSGALFEN